MKVSARNLVPCTIKQITPGAVNAEVIMEIVPGVELVSIITMSSLKNLELTVGKKVKAMMKASSVMVAVD